MIKCIKGYVDYDTNNHDFIEGNDYEVDRADTFGIYVLGEQGSSVYFDDEEELQEYFSY